MRPRYIAYIIIGLIAVIAFSSCGVLKGYYLNKYCKEKDSTHVSEHTTIQWDTVFVPQKVPVPGPIQYLDNPCKLLCDSLGKLKPVNIVKHKNGIKSTIKTNGGKLEFTCSEDSLKMVIEKQKTIIDTFTQDTKIVQEDCKKDHLTGWDYFWIKTGYILFLILVIWILVKVFKGYLKTWFPFLAKFL